MSDCTMVAIKHLPDSYKERPEDSVSQIPHCLKTEFWMMPLREDVLGTLDGTGWHDRAKYLVFNKSGAGLHRIELLYTGLSCVPNLITPHRVQGV